jgi:hypothetical protein
MLCTFYYYFVSRCAFIIHAIPWWLEIALCEFLLILCSISSLADLLFIIEFKNLYTVRYMFVKTSYSYVYGRIKL